MGAFAPLIIGLVEELVTQAPSLISEFQTLFSSGTPTAEQFATLRAKVAAEQFNVDGTNS